MKIYKYRFPLKFSVILATIASLIIFLSLYFTVHKILITFSLIPWWGVFVYWIYFKSMNPIKVSAHSITISGGVMIKGQTPLDFMKLVMNPMTGAKKVIHWSNILAVLPVDIQKKGIDIGFLSKNINPGQGVDINDLHWIRLNTVMYQNGDELIKAVQTNAINAVLINGETNSRNAIYWHLNQTQTADLHRIKPVLEKKISIMQHFTILLIIALILLYIFLSKFE